MWAFPLVILVSCNEKSLGNILEQGYCEQHNNYNEHYNKHSLMWDTGNYGVLGLFCAHCLG